jgi:hypothetical protein
LANLFVTPDRAHLPGESPARAVRTATTAKKKENAMRMRMCLPLTVAVALLIGQGSVFGGVPVGNEFTYQGQLKDGGIPANGDYDFVFRLFDAATGGTQIGGDVEIDGWPVSEGLFTVELDFGPDIFTGDARWIEVGVREGGGGGGVYTTLSPRQPVNAAPYALYALDGPGSAGYWAGSGNDIHSTNTGNVGVGTSNPLEKLHVAGPAANLRLQDDDDPDSYAVIKDTGVVQVCFEKHTSNGSTLMDFTPMPLDGVSGAAIRLFRTTNTTGDKHVYFYRGNNTTSTSAAVGVDGADSYFQIHGGNFGIGTLTPDAKLTVNGQVSSLSGGYKFPDGTVQVTAATSGTGFWSANGSHIYNNNTGYVGIGTASPSFNLHVYETGSGGFYPPARLGTQWFLFSLPDPQTDWFTIEVGGDYTMPGWGPGTRLVRESGTSLRFQTEDTINSAFRTTQMMLDPDGKLGIGTTTPLSLLEVVSDSGVHGVRSTTTGIPVAAIRTSTSGSWPAIHAESASSGSDATGIRSYLTAASPGTGSAAVLGCVNGTTMGGYGVHGSHAGYGIGVYGDSVNGTGVYARSTNGWALYAETLNGTTAARFVGNVEILSPSTQQILIEFGEGLDYAEGFDVSGESEIGPGTVLVIDAENAGQLAISTAPYDRKVAGIVAGANGLGSAVRLGAGQFDFDVALAGRVYCNVDASYGAVQPGDLLTTSPTPGYAMKVTDHAQAQGAILGKAMQPLKQGEQGQILVLVTLQ